MQMGKYCTTNQTIKNQRRINGLQLPLNFQQIVSWTVLIITAIINFSIISLLQFNELKIVSLSFFTILYVSHIASHVAALLIDPAEEELRNRDNNEVPEFDRNLHAHVIENGRCHLCNIYTSSKKTKHCGLCNKCVFEFDHHCKWLNNCIGQRNYFAFIGSVTTALFISTLTSTLCIADIVLFFKQPQLLSFEAQKFFNCTMATTNYVKYCQSSIIFLSFLVILCVSGIALACTLLHLCCFHIYISLLGVSTYEYIVQNSNTDGQRARCCKKKYLYTRKKEATQSDVSRRSKKVGEIKKNDTNVTNLINVLIASELNRAVKIFSPENNKVYPHQENGNS